LVFSSEGDTTARLLAGDAPSILNSNTEALCTIILWLLLTFSSLHLYYRLLPMRVLFLAGESICMMRTLCAMVELAIVRFPGSAFAALLLGTIGGSGSDVWINVERRCWGMDGGLNTGGVKLAFLSAYVYYSQHADATALLLPGTTPLLSLGDTRVCIAVFLILCDWSEELLHLPINPFWLWEKFFFAFVVGDHDPEYMKSQKLQQQQKEKEKEKEKEEKEKEKEKEDRIREDKVERDLKKKVKNDAKQSIASKTGTNDKEKRVGH